MSEINKQRVQKTETGWESQTPGCKKQREKIERPWHPTKSKEWNTKKTSRGFIW